MKPDSTGLTSEKLPELAARMARDLEQVAEIAPDARSRAQVMQIAADTRRIAEGKSIPDAANLPPLSGEEVETRLAELRASLARDQAKDDQLRAQMRALGEKLDRDRNHWLFGHSPAAQIRVWLLIVASVAVLVYLLAAAV